MVKRALEMNINKIAKRQLRDYRNINPGTCFSTDNFDLSIDEAYALQEAVVELRSQEGETVIGYKVGVLDLVPQNFLVWRALFVEPYLTVRFMKVV